MKTVKQNTAGTFAIIVVSATTGNPMPGISVFTPTLSKGGEEWAAITPTIAPLGAGRYRITVAATDRDTIGTNIWKFAASGARTAVYRELVVANLPTLDVELADAIVAKLNSVVLSELVEVERQFLPRFQLSDLESVKVIVAPLSREKRTTGRQGSQREYFIQIGVLQKLPRVVSDRDARVAELLRLVESIDDCLETAGPLAECSWLESINKPLYMPDELDEGAFRSVLTVKYTIVGRPLLPIPRT